MSFVTPEKGNDLYIYMSIFVLYYNVIRNQSSVNLILFNSTIVWQPCSFFSGGAIL